MIRARAGALAALTLSTIAPLATAFSPAFSVGLRRSAFSPAASGTLTSPLGLNGKRFTGVSRLSGGSGGALGATAGILDGQKAVDIDGKEVDLGSTYGNVPAVLVVNLASAWGLTSSNYAELVELTSQYSADQFTVLGFPCNQFGAQEPGSDSEIKAFAEGKGAKFPLFSKIEVNGAGAHPLYPLLKKSAGSADIGWNFEKFLIIGNQEVKNYGPRTSPKEIEPDIKSAMA